MKLDVGVGEGVLEAVDEAVAVAVGGRGTEGMADATGFVVAVEAFRFDSTTPANIAPDAMAAPITDRTTTSVTCLSLPVPPGSIARFYGRLTLDDHGASKLNRM